ncbi:MAG: hypothetical protein VKS61_12990, partial [Candidatus Sericytochromatia bacterium]|nr:hypothetical protein [Candidatus Sericytochromatia bacterium]
MLNELVYCPRLFHFMHVQGLMLQSPETLEGTAQHQRVEARRNKSAASRASGEVATSTEAADGGDGGPPWAVPRELSFASQALGIVGRLDAVETDGGFLAPVEAKRGRAPDPGRSHAFEGIPLEAPAWPGDQVQLAGQMLLLEQAGYPVRQGSLYYRESRTRVDVLLTPALR